MTAPASAQKVEPRPAIVAEMSADDPAYKTAFEETLKKPDDPMVLLKYAELAVKVGNYEGAISALERLLFIDGDQPRVKLELGVLYYRLGSYEAARGYLEGARASGRTTDEIKARAATFLSEIDAKTQKSRFYGDLLYGVQYSTNAISGPSGTVQSFGTATVPSPSISSKPDFNFLASAQVHHRYDLGRQDSGQMESDFTFYGTRQIQVSEANVVLVDFFTGPRTQPFDGALNAMSIKPFVTGRYVAVHDFTTYWAWGTGVEATTPIGSDVDAAFTLLGRRREFVNNPDAPTNTNSSGNEGTADLALHFRLSNDVSISLSPTYTRFIAQVASESFAQYGAGVTFAARFDNPLNFNAHRWVATLTGTYAHADYDQIDPTVDPNVRRRQDDYGVALSAAIPLDDRFTVVAQAAYNKRAATISNFTYDAFTTLAGISWRF